jgi:hypothetical protein
MAPIRGAERMSPTELQFELERGGKLVAFYYMCFASAGDLSSLIARVPGSLGRESDSESHALDCVDRGRRMVGHSVGTDLLDPIAGDEFSWGEGNSTPSQTRGPGGQGLSAKGKFRHIMVSQQISIALSN